MKITAIRTPIIEKGQHLLPIFQQAVPRPLEERDVICVTSKVIAIEQGRMSELATVTSSAARAGHAHAGGKDAHSSAQFVELVRQEADHEFGGAVVSLTLKDGIFVANAGIDLSNAPNGYAMLWPDRPWEWAAQFREQLCALYGVHELGIVVTDSRCVPLRRGVIGIAMAYAGFEGVESEKGKPDLFGHPLQFTEKAVADDLASAAVLVTGEAAEQTPFALVEDAPLVFTDRRIEPAEILVDPAIDMFGPIYSDDFKRSVGA